MLATKVRPGVFQPRDVYAALRGVDSSITARRFIQELKRVPDARSGLAPTLTGRGSELEALEGLIRSRAIPIGDKQTILSELGRTTGALENPHDRFIFFNVAKRANMTPIDFFDTPELSVANERCNDFVSTSQVLLREISQMNISQKDKNTIARATVFRSKPDYELKAENVKDLESFYGSHGKFELFTAYLLDVVERTNNPKATDRADLAKHVRERFDVLNVVHRNAHFAGYRDIVTSQVLNLEERATFDLFTLDDYGAFEAKYAEGLKANFNRGLVREALLKDRDLVSRGVRAPEDSLFARVRKASRN